MDFFPRVRISGIWTDPGTTLWLTDPVCKHTGQPNISGVETDWINILKINSNSLSCFVLYSSAELFILMSWIGSQKYWLPDSSCPLPSPDGWTNTASDGDTLGLFGFENTTHVNTPKSGLECTGDKDQTQCSTSVNQGHFLFQFLAQK